MILIGTEYLYDPTTL